MQAEQIFFSDQGLRQAGQNEPQTALSLHEAGLKFMHFILETQENNVFVYR